MGNINLSTNTNKSVSINKDCNAIETQRLDLVRRMIESLVAQGVDTEVLVKSETQCSSPTLSSSHRTTQFPTQLKISAPLTTGGTRSVVTPGDDPVIGTPTNFQHHVHISARTPHDTLTRQLMELWALVSVKIESSSPSPSLETNRGVVQQQKKHIS